MSPQPASNPAVNDDDPPPQPPTMPDDDACCGNGCDPCVYDLYETERLRYFEARRAWEARRRAAADMSPAPNEPGG